MPKYTFSIIASTGRTGTNFLGTILNELKGVLALHEGEYRGDVSVNPLLPMINLENRQCYYAPNKAIEVINGKRSAPLIETALKKMECHQLIEAAYYYSVLGAAVLEVFPEARIVGIIRDCESFVRSATVLKGEDKMPAGWAPVDKSLTDREKFIAMGRLKPKKDSEAFEKWSSFTVVQKNIWLWKETNQLLLALKSAEPKRVKLLPFEKLRQGDISFWYSLLNGLNLSCEHAEFLKIQADRLIDKKMSNARTRYFLGEPEEWTQNEQLDLRRANIWYENKVVEKFCLTT